MYLTTHFVHFQETTYINCAFIDFSYFSLLLMLNSHSSSGNECSHFSPSLALQSQGLVVKKVLFCHTSFLMASRKVHIYSTCSVVLSSWPNGVCCRGHQFHLSVHRVVIYHLSNYREKIGRNQKYWSNVLLLTNHGTNHLSHMSAHSELCSCECKNRKIGRK